MIDGALKETRERNLEKRREKLEDFDRRRYERATRLLDMQSVINQKLASNQASVDNAENYPSTWTTNPDGGANGQV